MKWVYIALAILIIAVGISVPVQATLIDRGNGLIYDSDLNITWLQNANLASQMTFGVGGILSSGQMGIETAQNWVAAMNSVKYLGYSNWRLPQTLPVNGNAYIYNFNYDGSSDIGYNISAPLSAFPYSTGSELAHLYYIGLGNKGVYNTSGQLQAGGGLTNAGLFMNLSSLPQPSAVTPYVIFWSGTPYLDDPAEGWSFRYDDGMQYDYDIYHAFYAWPVLPGDPASPGSVPPAPPSGNNVVFAVNAGGGQYTNSSGLVYQADTYYSGGNGSSTTASITNPPNDSAPAIDSVVYQTDRWGAFFYNVPLPNGNYTVLLKFAETHWNAPGQRVFNVTMQGNQVITNLDIFSLVGFAAACDIYLPAKVTNGMLNINFTPTIDNALVSAIVVWSGSASTGSSPDTTAPTVPAGLSATVLSQSQINLAWTTSTDPAVAGQVLSGLAGYDIYRNGTKIASVTTTNYSDTGLSPATAYSYTVDAYDNAGNKSPQSQPVTATTLAAQFTINATAGPGGSINPSGAVIVNRNASQSFTITPGTGYSISGVTVDGSSVGAVSSYMFNSVNANHTIAASFATNTYTITATSGTGGSISPSGATTVNSGSSQTYTITPSPGYSISNVMVDGSSIGAASSYTFSNTTSNHTIAATFSVIVSSNGGFGINAGGSGYTSISGIVYQPDMDYSGGSTYSTSASITGTSDAPIYQSQRYGNFSYTIPLSNGTYNVTLKFAELYWNSSGKRVFNVSMQGTQVISNLDVYSKVGQNAAYDVTVPVTVTNGTLNIVFTSVTDLAIVNAILVSSSSGGGPVTYTITASAGNGGSIAPSGTVTVNSGSSQTYTITPSPGYSISNVMVDGSSIGAASSYTFSNTTSNHTIAATFSVIVSSNGGFGINAGGSGYTSISGIVYQPDMDYSGGSTYSTSASITGTSDAPIYQSQRYGNFSYTIPLSNGTYNVTLKFAELYWNSSGKRVFNVSMQGTQVISNLDVYSKVGQNAAYDVTVPVTVTNGTLNIVFTSVTDLAIVNAIDITPSRAPTSFATNSGGGQYTSSSGVGYQADTDYSGGSTYSTSASITGTSDAPIYQSQRYGNFSYTIPLSNGTYNVTLKFAELYWNSSGKRVFNVSMQGTQVISNLDVYSKVGQNAAYDVTVPVTVTNGTLNIVFTSVTDLAIVNAIDITPQ